VSEYERGQRRVDVIELVVISRALGVSLLGLFTEIVRPAPGGAVICGWGL
jgi:transcriptional regulator with XRE-family HTH domain